MQYTKIKVSSQDDAKRFYRILAVKGDPDLYTLGAIIGSSLNAWFEHVYYFKSGRTFFEPKVWIDDFPFGDEVYDMGYSHLSNLGDSFVYCYDTGEGWDFDCKVYKRKFEYANEEEYPIGFVIEGKGQGIFENDHYTLHRYLLGDINPKSNEEDENKGQFLPMNMEFDTYGDFDKPLNLDEFIYFEDEMKVITNQFFNDYDQDDLNNEESDDDIIPFLNKVAGSIFLDEFTNEIFRKLIESYDINEAFDMIVQGTFQSLQECEDDYEEKFEKIYKKTLKKLK